MQSQLSPNSWVLGSNQFIRFGGRHFYSMSYLIAPRFFSWGGPGFPDAQACLKLTLMEDTLELLTLLSAREEIGMVHHAQFLCCWNCDPGFVHVRRVCYPLMSQFEISFCSPG